MSFTDDYLEAKKKKKKTTAAKTGNSFTDEYLSQREKSQALNIPNEEDIAPVRTTTTKAKEKEEDEERTWFSKGAFEDGYQFGDISMTILGTTTDILEDVGTGVLGMGERLVDAGAYVAGGVGKMLGDDGFADWTKEFIAKDLYDEKKIAQNILSGGMADEFSVLGEKSDSLLQSAGQLGATIGLQAVGVPWFVTTGLTSFGGEVEGAFNEGASYGEAGLSAAITAGAEMLTEKISGGISFGGKTLDDAITKNIARNISNKTVRTLSKLGMDMFGEGAEEVLSGVMSAIGQKITYADDKELKDLFSKEEAFESFVGGAVLGGGMSGANVIKSKVNGVDYASGLTANEEKVVNKVYNDRVAEAEKNGKITDKEKSKIYDEVLDEMEKGGISTDTIEEVLGGNTYQNYQNTVKNEDSLRETFNQLNQMKQGEMTGEQIDLRNELKEQLKEMESKGERNQLKSQLGNEVMSLVQGDRLIESYNERSRRGQAFEADLTKYDEKQKAVVQKAIDSGILNNTRRTHEFVDMVSKISADKGVLFDFANNQKLKDSGFAVEGKTVNGFVTKDGVTLNIDSAKSLNSVVGHEITHVLEGTELYTELQSILKTYAETKGEYQSRYDSVAKLYDGIEGANVDAELTADLVGDYLFTDSDFINNLSTNHRNVFQKIYDEVKYLCKVATAGSKEARELEKVKRAFESAYKAQKNTTDDDGVKYSIGEIVDESGNSYGIGVHLDSDLLTGLTDAERKQMVKLRVVEELAGDSFIAYDNGNPVEISIARKNDKIKNASGNKKPVLKELYDKYIGNETKQEAVVLADELIEASKHNSTEPSNYSHEWLDNYGKNNWDKRTVYLQDKNKTVWKATLHIANSTDGRKILYDIGPIEMTEGAMNLAPTTVNTKVPQDASIVNQKNSLSNGEAPVYGSHNVFGKDIALPTVSEAESVQESAPVVDAENAPTTPPISGEIVEDIAPVDVSNGAVLKRLNSKLSNSNEELANNERLRAESIKSFDEKIAKAQAELDAKKNKDTKVANSIKRRIERLQRLKADRDAEYAKRIGDIKARVAKTEENVAKYHPGMDRTEKAVARIDKMLEHDKSELTKEFGEKRESLKDKNSYISNKASELYNEIRNLKKGVRASKLLGELLDSGHDWSSIRSALVNIKHTPSETVNVNSAVESLVRETLDEDYENTLLGLDEDYANRIKQMEDDARTKRKNATVAAQRKTKQKEYSDQIESLVGDTSTWVDKKMGISYRINTLRRNLRDIVRDASGKRDIAKADAIYEELQGNYNTHEAMLNREANRIKKAYADMKITAAEDAYIQMLGEFRHNPDTKLTEAMVKEFYEEHKNSIDEAKVDKAIKMARDTYDELLVRVNEVLREQGMKEIPYRKGYFPHFTEDKQSFLAKLFNWKTHNNDIPTDIAGLTEQFNPNRSWQSFNKQRKSDTTDYSFLKGLDTYVQGSLDWVYHIEDIQKRRAFENHIRYVHSEKGVQEKIDAIRNNEEYDADEVQEQIDLVLKEAGNPLNNFVTDLRAGTNTLANKKSSLDRGMEEMTNRKFYSTMTNISNRVSANMVGGSVSSALTNFIPITQSWGEVSPVSSLRAMGDTIRSTFRDDGVVDKSDFLTNRLRKSDNLYKTTWDKISDKVGILMEGVDSFTSQTVWRSKYIENISNGMSENEAIKNADQFAENVMAGRSRGNMPTIFDSKNPLIKTVTAFQLEVANQYGYMFKDMPQEMKNESVGKLVKGYAAMFMGAYAYNALYSSLVGRDAAFDPIGIIEELLKDIGLFGDDEEEEPKDVAMNLLENVLDETPFVGGLLGGGRIPIASAIPYDGNFMDVAEGVGKLAEGDYSDLTSEWMKPVYYLALPVGGGQIKKTVQGLKMFSDDHPIAGSYTDSGKLRFTVEDNLANRVQAGIFGQYASKNARQYFDEGRSPLSEKQTQELVDIDVPIQEYWAYRDGLKNQETLEDKFEYINDLDLPVEKKNILINNVVDRKEKVDMSNYDEFENYEEFDFYTKNKEKYEFLKENGVSFVEYRYTDEVTEKYNNIYSWYKNNPEKVTVAKAVTDNIVEYRKYASDLNDIRADKDANGDTINGTAKAKKVDYINSLDLDYGQKIILYRSMFDSKEDKRMYNAEIVEYLNNRQDISYDDMVTILEELDMKVDANENVTW